MTIQATGCACGICQPCVEAEAAGHQVKAAPDGLSSPLTADDFSGYTIPADDTTTQDLSPGGTRDGTLDFTGDRDWYRLVLSPDQAVRIDLTGLDHTAGNGYDALADPYLRIYDVDSTYLLADDDGGAGYSASLILSNSSSSAQTYFVEAAAYADAFTGDYRLTADTVQLGDESPVDAVQSGYTLNTSDPINVYFSVAGDTYSNSQYGTLAATGTNPYEQAQLWSIFQNIETFVDMDFQITTVRSGADLQIATSNLPSSGGGTLLGFFYFPNGPGYGFLNDQYPGWTGTSGGSLDTAGFMYGVAIHEIGHGLGLAHTHDSGAGTQVMRGVSGPSDRGDYDLNMAAYTVMSYIEGSVLAGVASNQSPTGHAATFGALDIAALQNMYGANTAHAAGDDVYTLIEGNTTGSGAGYYTTWDTGGTDEFRYTGASDAVIDLRAATLEYEPGGGGFLSYLDGTIGARSIAAGVIIENAMSGSGDDTLTGNAAANTLIAGAGADSLSGNAGDDQLDGGFGADTMAGGTGNDTYFVDNAGDALIEDPNEGRDTVYSSIAIDLRQHSQQLDVLVLTGAADIDGTGTWWDNTITGNTGDNELDGAWGNDILYGGDGDDILRDANGADTLIGGAGNDTYYVDDAGDVLVENPNEGRDTVFSSISIDLRQHSQQFHVLTLTGSEDIDGTGTWWDNTITGNSGDNVLEGAWGNDTLYGGDGDDTLRDLNGADMLFGGLGDDTYHVDNVGDVLVEDANAGLDTVLSSVSIALRDFSQHLDILTLTGTDDIDGTGNWQINTITGNSGDNTLNGAWWDDVLYGGDGNDTFRDDQGNDAMYGGAGDDTLFGGPGDDLMLGGADMDTFVFGPGSGNDDVADFQDDTDLLDFSAHGFADTGAALALASQIGADTVFEFSDGATVTVRNMIKADLQDDLLIV